MSIYGTSFHTINHFKNQDEFPRNLISEGLDICKQYIIPLVRDNKNMASIRGQSLIEQKWYFIQDRVNMLSNYCLLFVVGQATPKMMDKITNKVNNLQFIYLIDIVIACTYNRKQERSETLPSTWLSQTKPYVHFILKRCHHCH